MAADQSKAGQPAKILKHEQNGYRIQWRDDGTDYPALLDEFRQGKLKMSRLSTGSPYREVYKVEALDRLFVMKKDWEIDERLEKRLWIRLAGTFYDRLLKLTNQAIGRGCPVVQDVYLVAEKMDGRFCREAYLIAEYVKGDSFIVEEYVEGRPIVGKDPSRWLKAIGQALGVLHDYGLASNDAQPGNFVITEDQKVKAIDLSINGPLIVCQANDILKMKRSFNVDVPIRSPWRNFIYFFVYHWYYFRKRLRQARKKPC